MFFFNEKSEKNKYLDILNSYGLPLDDGNYWWRRYPKRAVEEITAMKNGTSSRLIQEDDKLIWQEEITNNFSSSFAISIETNSKYPFSMPKIFVLEPHIEPSDDKHMFKDGSLCLMHSSAYNSRISILQFRNQAAAWCFCIESYAHTGEWGGAEHKH